MEKTVFNQWELIHHDKNSVMELILRCPEEKDEKIWMTYEELNNLKLFLGNAGFSRSSTSTKKK